MIELALIPMLAAISAQGADASALDDDASNWAKARHEALAGWRELDVLPQSIVFTRPAKAQADYPQIWTRTESRTGATRPDGFSYRSFTTLEEIDCRGRRLRPLLMTYYSDSDLKGRALSIKVKRLDWFGFEAPGTLGGREVERACSG